MTFAERHIGTTPEEQTRMLEACGFARLEDLLDAAVPPEVRTDPPLDGLPAAVDEAAVLARARAVAARNRPLRSFIGLGYHGTRTPAVIRRNLLEEPGWYTAYTPYQPEISQGRLELLMVFQTMVEDLTGLPVANASLLDEPTAAAEAMTLLRRVSDHPGHRFAVDTDVHPPTAAVLRTRAAPLGIEIVEADLRRGPLPEGCFGVLLQQPSSTGLVADDRALIAALHDRDVLVAVATDLLACTLVVPPGEQGADVVVGSAQRFGVPPWFGGPHAAYIATRREYVRALPGRLVGASVDRSGRTAYRLALQTREQHIRRERATSNICTAQVLLALVAAAYAVWHGPDGLRAIAQRINRLTAALRAAIVAAGGTLRHPTAFDTLTVRVPGGAARIVEAARARGYNLREVDADHVGVTLDETVEPAEVADLAAVFGASEVDVEALLATAPETIPEELRRHSAFLTHPVFHQHHTETAMMRYLRRLRDRDLALDRTMIPLGSCTMKLNAAAELEPITWPEFTELHPFAPLDQAEGMLEIIRDLERWLCEITGFDAVSLQPNAGSQGELAGLLAIRRYHEDRGEPQRDVCLIPASAHGTNAASAVMAGMRVVVVGCDEDGNIDLDDLKGKVAEHADHLAAIMVTFPSTHGVFEAGFPALCELVHRHGGQVYLDGANLNALVGLTQPGRIGADICHLNLHKTFCIPHGGGGPGVGPVACRAHLAPFLPNHPLVADAGPASGPGPVAGAPWGSAGILPISWAYIQLMGADGLRRATATAILHANYIAARLRDHYPILYTGAGGLVAHECIIDLRPLRRRSGITVEDVAKRLIDYGFHAPTMAFPVEGTLMIEPTESEPLVELDRFCAAMIAIREEIEAVAEGRWPRDDNPLVNAPHTAEELLREPWTHPYSREVAAFPAPWLRGDKYWPPVARIDQAYGDRHLVCACPPVEEYA